MFFPRSSLFRKLIILFVFSLIFIVGINSYYFYVSAEKEAKARLQLAADRIMNRILNTFTRPLSNLNGEEVEVAIILEMARDDVLAILLKDKNGDFYMGKIKDEQWGISYYQPDEETKKRLSNSFIHLSRKMTGGDRLVGYVDLYISNRALIERQRVLKKNIFIQLVLLSASMIFVLLLTLNKYIFKPLAALKEAAEHCTEKDFSKKVSVHSNDEIGQLGRAFNRMAARLNEYFTRTETQIFQIKEAAVDKEELLVDLKRNNESLNNRIAERKEVETRMRESKQSLEKLVEERSLGLKKADELLRLEVDRREKTESDLRGACADLDSARAQLIQSEKLASIGQLSAGIAHEINNPLGFIGSNIYVFEKHIQNLEIVNKKVQDLMDVMKTNDLEKIEGVFAELVHSVGNIDVNFIFEDLKNLLGETRCGVDRIKNIVADLRTFSRRDEGAMVELNINDLIEGILNIVWSEVKFKCELKKEYGAVPAVLGNIQKIGQVFINLFVNAAQSIEKKGIITIRTYTTDSFVCAEIIDTGRGMEPDVVNKIFDPFYTTKRTGEGTGLGLSISSEIIQKHQGCIEVESQVGRGSKFTVSLPMIDDAKDA